ncbi:MAG: hypothetical protein QOK37_1753 [Thermoanaerobaculia bacterium]|jgi:hypothetical protein|nr:hypothetical protein [Thermoanaerobaculia bacterium]
MINILRRFLTPLLALAFTVPALAATFVVPTDRDLVQRAHVIVIATPLTSFTRLSEEGGIETVTPIRVEEVLKGRTPGDTLNIVEPGGEYDGKAMIIAGVPRFENSERTLLFLMRTGTDRWAVCEVVLGKFTFRQAGKILLLQRDADEIIGWDADLRPHKEHSRDARRFLNFVRIESRGVAAPEDYFVPDAVAAAVPAQRKATASSLMTIQPLVAPYTANSYTMLISGSLGSRWNVFPSAVTFVSGTTQEPGAPGGGTTAISAAFASWDNDCASNVNYVYGGTDNGTHTQGLHTTDGANTILFERDLSSWGIAPFTCSANGYSGTLGIGGITSASGTNTVSGENFATTLEADVEMNKGLANCTLLFSNGDFNSAVTHEVGHTLGFRHSDQSRDSSSACSSDPLLECSSQAIMKSFISQGLNGALQVWDQHAVQAVYPGNICLPGTCTPPAITSQPASTTVPAGSSATLSVSASGTAPLSYQWYIGSSGSTASPLPGATGPSQTVTPSTTTSYWVLVSNSCGSVNSNTATVTVTASPSNLALQRRRPDFNGDNRADILWRNSISGANYMYLMNGATIVSAGQINTVDLQWQVGGTGDFNGDGKWDILWRNSSTGENYMYLMSGLTIVSAGSVNTIADQNWRVVATGDFDGDGKSDILWRNSVTGSNYIYLMNGLAIRGQGEINVTNSPWQVAGTGDFDGDGKSDILWRNSSTGEDYIYLMNGLTIRAAGAIATVATNWIIAGTGDFDGDGKSDILWRNNTTGENVIYLMNGMTIRNSGTVNSVPANWIVAGTGDYDGDGKSDILWRNTLAGDVYVYLMNGFAIRTAGTVNVVDPSWKIVQ